MADLRMCRCRQLRLPDEDQRQGAARTIQIPLKELEQLLAPLVLVNPPDVDRKSGANAVFLPKSIGLGIRRDMRADADHHFRDVAIAGDRLNHHPLFGRVVHDSPGAAEYRTEHSEPDG